MFNVGINPDYDYLYDPQQDPPGTRVYGEEEDDDDDDDD